MSLTYLEPWAFAVLTAFVFRATWFLIYDSLTGTHPDVGSWLGKKIDRFAYNQDLEGTDRNWWRGKLGDLATCPYCLSPHITWITLAVWTRTWPWDFGVNGWVMVMAVAGAAAVLLQANYLMKERAIG